MSYSGKSQQKQQKQQKANKVSKNQSFVLVPKKLTTDFLNQSLQSTKQKLQPQTKSQPISELQIQLSYNHIYSNVLVKKSSQKQSYQSLINSLKTQNKQLKKLNTNLQQKLNEVENKQLLWNVKINQQEKNYQYIINQLKINKDNLQKEKQQIFTSYQQMQKKTEFYQDKIQYLNQQIQRYQKFLKIKDQIISNFQWQKSLEVSKLQQNTNNYKLQQTTSKQNIQRHKMSIGKLKVSYKKQIIPEVIIPEVIIQVNQTLDDLSQINFNQQNQIHSNQQCLQLQKSKLKIKTKKYKIGHQKESIQYKQKRKSKLNLSLSRKADESINKQIYNQQDFQINKSKNILIKRLIPIRSSQQKKYINQAMKQKNNRIEQLLKILQQKQSQILQLEKQFKNPVKSKIFTQQNQNIQNASRVPLQKIQKKVIILKQKCQILEAQLEKTIRKLISTQDTNKQLQDRIKDYEQKYEQKQMNDNKIYNQKRRCITTVDDQIVKPNLQDLITPQFKENHVNYFAKQRPHDPQQTFQKINLPN